MNAFHKRKTGQLIKCKNSENMGELPKTSAKTDIGHAHVKHSESARHALLNILAYISYLLTENDSSQIITDINHFVTDFS